MSENVLFWNVDTQVDFIYEDAKLPVPGAEDIRGNLARLTRLVELHTLPRVNTADNHIPSDDEIVQDPDEADFVNTYPEHCMRGTEGQQYIVETQPSRFEVFIRRNSDVNEKLLESTNEVVIFKNEFNVFEGNDQTDDVLDVLVDEPNDTEVFVYGVSGNVCVMHAVDGLLRRGFNVTVVEDAVASLPAEGGLSSWEELREEWQSEGVNFVTTDDVIERFD